MRTIALLLLCPLLLFAACDSEVSALADSAVASDASVKDLGVDGAAPDLARDSAPAPDVAVADKGTSPELQVKDQGFIPDPGLLPDLPAMDQAPVVDQAASPELQVKDQGLIPDPGLLPDLPAMDQAPVADQAPVVDQAVVDQGSPDSGSSQPADQALADQKSTHDGSAMDPSMHTSVINKFMLPSTPLKLSLYSFDLTGDGKLNNVLGTLLGFMTSFSSAMDMQPYADNLVNSGTLLAMMELYGKSLVSDPSIWIQTHLGKDLDSNPKDNFTGSEQFGLHALSPVKSIVTGNISAGKMAASSGSLIFPVPLAVGATPVLVTLKKLHIKATVASSGMTQGVVGGAVNVQELKQKVLPAMAAIMNQIYQAPTTPLNLKTLLRNNFDANKDNKISAAEVQNNLLVNLLMVPDVDTDGDNKPDAISFGMGFTSVSCSIKKTP